MRSEGFSFYFADLGVETCWLDAASGTAGSRRQPSATVGNRSRWWGRCGRAYGEFCKNVHFWKFQSSRSLVSSGRRGTLWHSNMFHNVSKIVLRGMAQYFRVVFRRWGAFFGAGAALWRTPLSFCVAGVAVQTCCVACFFLRIAVSGLREVVTTCKFRGRSGILWHVMKIAVKPLTKHRFWGSKFWGSWQNSWEHVDFEATKCENLRQSRRKCSFWSSNMSRLDSLVFFCRRRVYERSCKTCHFRRFQNKLSCRFAWQAWHLLTFSRVCKSVQDRFVWQARYFCKVFRRWVAFFVAGVSLWRPPSSFCVAGAALQTCRVACFLRIALSGQRQVVSTDKFWQAWGIVRVFFRVARVAFGEDPSCVEWHLSCQVQFLAHSITTRHTLHLHFTLYTPDSTLYTLHSALHSILHTLHSTLYTPHFTLHTLQFTLSTPLYTLHSTLYTLHFTIHAQTPHFTRYNHTLHFTLYTPHSTLHFTLHTLHSTVRTPHFALHSPQSTLHTPHSTLYTLHFKLHTLHSTLYNLPFPLHTAHCTPHTSHVTFQTLYTLHFTLHTLHFTLHIFHFTLLTPHSTLYTLHSTLYTSPFTLYTPHFTLHTLHSTLYTSHFPPHTLHFALPTTPTSHSTLTLHSISPTEHTTFFTLHTLPSTPLHIPQSTLDWHGNRGKMEQSTSSTAQGGGGSFKKRKPIGEKVLRLKVGLWNLIPLGGSICMQIVWQGASIFEYYLNMFEFNYFIFS